VEGKIHGIQFHGRKLEETLGISSEPFHERLPFRPKSKPPGANIFPMG
jgi:hypothetical protein